MNAPKFEVFRTQKEGKPALDLVVRNSLANADRHALGESLGYNPLRHIANRRAIVCTTPEEVDAARNPLVRFFNAKGECK